MLGQNYQPDMIELGYFQPEYLWDILRPVAGTEQNYQPDMIELGYFQLEYLWDILRPVAGTELP